MRWLLLIGAIIGLVLYLHGFFFEGGKAAPLGKLKEAMPTLDPDTHKPRVDSTGKVIEPVVAKEPEVVPNSFGRPVPVIPLGRESVAEMIARKQEVKTKVLNYTFTHRQAPSAVELSKLLGEKMFVDLSTNSITLTVPEKEMAHTLTVLSSLDVEPKTLEISAVLGVFRLEAGYEFGMEWLLDTTGLLGSGSTAALGSAFSFNLKPGSFQWTLNEGKRQGILNILARPTLACISGGTAQLSTGRQIAVPVVTSNNRESRTSVEFREVALSLDVSPVLVAGNRVILTITQTNDDVLGFRTIDRNEVPEISSQTLTSSITVGLGDWIALGGATLVNHSDSLDQSTLVERIPILGNLFRNEKESWERVEVGVFLKASLAGVASVPVSVYKPRVVEVDPKAHETLRKRSFWSKLRRRK